MEGENVTVRFDQLELKETKGWTRRASSKREPGSKMPRVNFAMEGEVSRSKRSPGDGPEETTYLPHGIEN